LLIEGEKKRKLFLFTRWIATHMKRNAERRREREKKTRKEKCGNEQKNENKK
jgi:hypothetical protein